ncbi:MAG: hypothetical protein AVDCRST_MAG41-1529, partial [uncultured Corynebacteriales bacterium]
DRRPLRRRDRLPLPGPGPRALDAREPAGRGRRDLPARGQPRPGDGVGVDQRGPQRLVRDERRHPPGGPRGRPHPVRAGHGSVRGRDPAGHRLPHRRPADRRPLAGLRPAGGRDQPGPQHAVLPALPGGRRPDRRPEPLLHRDGGVRRPLGADRDADGDPRGARRPGRRRPRARRPAGAGAADQPGHRHGHGCPHGQVQDHPQPGLRPAPGGQPEHQPEAGRDRRRGRRHRRPGAAHDGTPAAPAGHARQPL